MGLLYFARECEYSASVAAYSHTYSWHCYLLPMGPSDAEICSGKKHAYSLIVLCGLIAKPSTIRADEYAIFGESKKSACKVLCVHRAQRNTSGMKTAVRRTAEKNGGRSEDPKMEVLSRVRSNRLGCRLSRLDPSLLCAL